MQFQIIQSSPERPRDAYATAPQANSIILFLTANPSDTQTLKINKEFNKVQEESESATHALRVRLRLDVSRSELLEIFLRDRPAILHFSGHGLGEKGLIMQNEDGLSELLSTQALSALLSEFSDSLQCVLLNACYSVEQARAIALHVPFVIGIDNAIGDAMAISFSHAFYTCLFLGEGYESAFRKAVVQVGLDAFSGANPILYCWNPTEELVSETSTEKVENKTDSQPKTKRGRSKELDYDAVIPAHYPDMKMLIPTSHQVTKDDEVCYESQDHSTYLRIKVYQEPLSLSETLHRTFELENMQWRQSIDSEHNYEQINGMEAYWVRAFWPKKGWNSYLLAFYGYGDAVISVIISFDEQDETAMDTANFIFNTFELLTL